MIEQKLINQIITAKIMGMDPAKYHRLVLSTEQAGWFRERVRNKELELNYHLHLTGRCTPGSLGQFTESGFLLSCRHFAVTYTLSPDVTVDKNWHTLRHITQRNNITARIMGIISRFQRKFVISDDPLTLRRFPYRRIVDEYKRDFPESYMDISVLSRVVKNKSVIVNGRETSLAEFLPTESYLIGVRILKLLDTVNPFLTDSSLQRELKNTFGLHLSRRYVAYCRNLMGIPVARLRRRKSRNFFSLGLVAQNLFVLKHWVGSRRPQASMGLA